jgi:hypothetical protein
MMGTNFTVITFHFPIFLSSDKVRFRVLVYYYPVTVGLGLLPLKRNLGSISRDTLGFGGHRSVKLEQLCNAEI